MGRAIAAGRHIKKKGSARMAEFGYKKVEVWFDQAEAQVVIFAADKAGKKLSTWVRSAAVEAAKKM
jgi:hypothetical protein